MPRGVRTDRISERDLEVLEFIARFGVVPRQAVSVWADTRKAVTLARERRLRLAKLIELHPRLGPLGPFALATRVGLRACGRPELRPARLLLRRGLPSVPLRAARRPPGAGGGEGALRARDHGHRAPRPEAPLLDQASPRPRPPPRRPDPPRRRGSRGDRGRAHLEGARPPRLPDPLLAPCDPRAQGSRRPLLLLARDPRRGEAIHRASPRRGAGPGRAPERVLPAETVAR